MNGVFGVQVGNVSCHQRTVFPKKESHKYIKSDLTQVGWVWLENGNYRTGEGRGWWRPDSEERGACGIMKTFGSIDTKDLCGWVTVDCAFELSLIHNTQ